MVVNGWTLFAHPLFLEQVGSLTRQVESLRERHPDAYKQKNLTKRLAAIRKLIFELIPQDPSRAEYRQGKTPTRRIHHPSYCDAARPASAAFGSVAHPQRTGEHDCGALGRETPQPLDLTTPRDGRVVNTAGLGDQHKHWFRAKFFQQYRLFFRYHASSRIIVYAWVNDTKTLRAYESKSDAYRVFRRMLESGHPPDDWEGLLQESREMRG